MEILDIDQQTFWLLIAATTVLGLLFGLLIGPRIGAARKASRSLQEVQDEHASYKRQVTDHFEKSAQLFASLTQDYRELYRHLAEGSERLADGVSENLALSGESLPALPTAAAVPSRDESMAAMPDADDIDAPDGGNALADTEAESDVPPVMTADESDMDSQLRTAAEGLAGDADATAKDPSVTSEPTAGAGKSQV